jgi:circadian clock protein KaiB
MASEHEAALRRLEDRLAHLETADYMLTLFVNGASDMSVRAIGNVRALCERHLEGRYRLEVVDVHRDAALMAKHQVLAVPTLIREQPLPQRRIVGDLSDVPRVLAGLDIRSHEHPAPASAREYG